MDSSNAQANGQTPRSHTTLPKLTTSLNRAGTAPQRHVQRRHRRTSTARAAIQSAVQLQSPFSFDSYNPLRRTDKDKEHSHRPHLHIRHTADKVDPRIQQAQASAPEVLTPVKKSVTTSDLAHVRSLRAKHTSEVSNALELLSKEAHNATRRLDDTYYSLLEKENYLRSTLGSLQRLTEAVKQDRTQFGHDTENLGRKLNGQLSSYGNFETQEQSIEELVKRLRSGKERSQELEDRLEKCRTRLEAYEAGEKEAARVRRRRWGMFWTALGSIIAIFVAILVWRNLRGKQTKVLETMVQGARRLGEIVVFGGERNRSDIGIHLEGQGSSRVAEKRAAEWKHVLDEL